MAADKPSSRGRIIALRTIRKLLIRRRLTRRSTTVGHLRRWRLSSATTVFVGGFAAMSLAGLIVTGCAESFRGLGITPAVAESHANEVFEAVAARFTSVELTPKYDQARAKLTQAALVPSRVFDDTSVWSLSPSASTRILLVHGAMDDKAGRYRLEAAHALAPLIRGGDTRHTMELQSIEPDVFRWTTNVDMGIGPISAEELSNLCVALMAAPEGRNETQVREDYRAAFPKTSAVFGRGFAIDSMHVAPAAAGGTSVVITAGFHPETMRAAYPLLADYLDKYLGPAKYHFALADRAGTPLLDVLGRDRMMTVRYRLNNGKLSTLAGAPRPWPDTVRLTSDVSVKVKLFRVGFHQLVTDFVISNVGHERAFTIIAQKEPEWEMPLATAHLLRTPLHRPFLGQGSMLQLSVHDSVGAQTVFARRTRFDVQESTIARFLGSIAGRMIGDLDGKVEVEEDRFLRDGFVAMQADLKAVARTWRARDADAIGGGGASENATKR